MLTLHTDQGLNFELAAGVIRRAEGAKQTELPLAEIVRVRAARLGEMGMLELAAGDGRKLVVISDRRARGESATRFRAFAEELHRQLVEGGRPVEYTGGLQIAPALGAIAGAGMIALAWTNPMHYSAGRLYIAGGIGVISLLFGVLLTITNRKKFYDPLNIPPHMLP